MHLPQPTHVSLSVSIMWRCKKNPTLTITLCGHASTHFQHALHLRGSILMNFVSAL